MINREKSIAQVLQNSRWADWTQTPLAGDASARRYLRLTKGDQSVILMDADPAKGQDTQAFAKIGDWLRRQNLNAPDTLLHDPNLGLMIIADLGAVDLAKHLQNHPAETLTLYTAATDVLIQLDAAAPPPDLPVMTPKVGGEMVTITTEWYGNCDGQALASQVTDHLQRLCGPADTIALRDFHAENLIWRPAQKGTDRTGLLDYQDAFIAPRGYDLISLLRDVRRAVDPDIASKMTSRFITATGAKDAAAGFACLAVQRNLRILGVFARLAKRDGKTRYIKMIPHIWDMITTDLSHPGLETLEDCVRSTLPTPENSEIQGLL